MLHDYGSKIEIYFAHIFGGALSLMKVLLLFSLINFSKIVKYPRYLYLLLPDKLWRPGQILANI